MKDLSFSPQCLGLGVPSEEEGRGPSCKREELTWRHDMDSRETAACMGECQRPESGPDIFVRLLKQRRDLESISFYFLKIPK